MPPHWNSGWSQRWCLRYCCSHSTLACPCWICRTQRGSPGRGAICHDVSHRRRWHPRRGRRSPAEHTTSSRHNDGWLRMSGRRCVRIGCLRWFFRLVQFVWIRHHTTLGPRRNKRQYILLVDLTVEDLASRNTIRLLCCTRSVGPPVALPVPEPPAWSLPSLR